MVHIKKVLIQGFKSYKDQTWFDDFHEQVNCIAIRFVLADMFTNLGKEERQALLHEGSGDTVMSAFVEIVFDNRDGRFPIDKDEVVLRRTIGIKKDEYFLDKKHVTKHDVVNLLESAGFSRSNPYYIVQQGKVTALAMMKDSERLDLLKEVAGARVYDERKDETTKIMRDSETKRAQIAEMLAHIEERLRELESEKEELKEYQKLDKSRRALEYTLYDKELSQAMDELKRIEGLRAEETDQANAIYNKVAAVHDQLRTAEREVKLLNSEIAALQKDRSLLEEERQENIKERARLELEVKDRRAKSERDATQRKQLQNELNQLEKSIGKTTTELEQVTPQYDKEADRERKVNERLQDIDRRVNQLYSKQGRSAQFKNKKDRDAHLNNEIKQLNTQIKALQDQISTARQEITAGERTLRDNTKEAEGSTGRLEELRGAAEQATKQLNDLRTQRDDLSNQRKELWRRDSELEAQTQILKNELQKAERALQSTVNKITSAGLTAVKRIVSENRIPGVYGPLIELFSCPEQYTSAVEVTAGNSLFHVVVDTDETAATILEHMNREKAGRVTFIPLSQIQEKRTDMPISETATPMLNELEFKPMFRKAFQLVFGKTLICRDLQVAAQYSRSHNLDCVTLDGDQVNRKGALTGGYVDQRVSRLEAMNNIRKWRGKLDELGAEHAKIQKTLEKTDQQITSVLGELQKLETQRTTYRDTHEQLALRIKTLSGEIQTLTSTLEQKRTRLAELESSERALSETRKALQEELGTELLSKLTDREQAELVSLQQEAAQLREQLIAFARTRTELESRKTQLTTLLNENLRKRQQELREETERLGVEEQRIEADQLDRQLSGVNKRNEDAAARLKEKEKAIEEKEQRVRELKAQVDDIKTGEAEQTRALQQESERMEKLLNQRSQWMQKKDESERKIREIGSLPSDLDDYRKLSQKQVLKQLQNVNRDLKKYSHVNKKALDQYMHFSEQRDKFVERKKELDEGAQAIEKLIDVLDKRKDEALNRTVKGVAFHFKEVFASLVEGGSGELIMQKPKEPTEQQEGGLGQYTGVSIKVRFSETDEYHLMGQLSGGQKSLVALALVFAIQRCDPAPFYLFDEIDSALDDRYRASVAAMIREQSRKVVVEEGEQKEEKTQFIVSTFRPELVRAANKCYAITFKGKESQIVPVEREQALQVIQSEAQEPVHDEEEAESEE